ncbi:MAG: TonB family protein [Myxococcota bacterium]
MPPGWPSWEIVASLWLHLMVFAGLVFFERCGVDDGPLIDPDQVTTIQLASLKQYAEQEQLATRAPTRDPSPTPPEPTPAPPEPTPPPPQVPTSDMVLPVEEDQPDPDPDPHPHPDPTPPEPREQPQNNTDRREELLAQLNRSSADSQVEDPNVRVGREDRAAAGPDGVEGVVATIIGIGDADPVLGQYILACREAILPNWTPLPKTLAEHPEYVVVVQAPVAADGALGAARIVQSSGDSSFDRSAILALAKTRKLPPPPAEWQASAAKGIQFRLAAKDK